MCGIAGIFDFKLKGQIDESCLSAMIRMIGHRGPDRTTTKLFENVGLAHARLSIIDLKTGDQPIHNEDRSVWTIFNGEIFNYIELRDELIRQGHDFSTKSDTEVIVHLYEEYGESFVSHLNGQFAIALYDTKLNKLLLVRDRVDIGVGACILGDVIVRHDTVIGANSVVVRSFPAHSTLFGVPARPVNLKPKGES